MAAKPALVRVKRRREDPAPENLGMQFFLFCHLLLPSGLCCLPGQSSNCELRSVGVVGEIRSSSFRSFQVYGSFGTVSPSKQKAQVPVCDYQ